MKQQNNEQKTENNFNIYAIGNAHIDPVWQWNKSEGYKEVFATFRSSLDRLSEFPSTYFAASSAQFYEWILESDPEMFKEIQQRVREGRWILVGGWWVESDINCTTGESLVRQGLYAQHFFSKYFGKSARIGFSPDTFGHAWSLPQILKKQGMETYFYMRPDVQEKKDLQVPMFIWRGPDKTDVLAISIISSYAADAHDIEKRIDEHIKRFSQFLPNIKSIAVLYGVGNHGGGPTIAAINKIEELRAARFPGLRFASIEKFIEKIEKQLKILPIVNDELLHHARGCYSACANVKKRNRITSSALLMAEKCAAIANFATNFKYPMYALQVAWKKVLFNQFHDLLAGTSIEEAYFEAESDYGYAQSVANDIILKALYNLTGKINTEDIKFPLSSPIVAFNPCSWAVNRFIEFETELLNLNTCGKEKTVLRNSAGKPFPKKEIILRDHTGNSVPYQMLKTAAVNQQNQPYRARILFKANIPSLGYHVYRLDFSQKEIPPVLSGVKVSDFSLENNLVRIQFDKEMGSISSYFDKKLNREIFKQHGAVPKVFEDWDDTWGHRIDSYDIELGRFKDASFTIIENGPERGRIRIKTFWGQSFLIQDFALLRDSNELECFITINWNEKYKVLKLSFPTVLENGICTYSIPYGFIERPMSGNEEPAQEWVDVSSANKKNAFGFAIINDSKCGYSVKEGDIHLTVFHSTAWSHHNPEKVSKQENFRYMEQGIHEFKYKLVPHKGDWRQANIPHKSEEFLFPPKILNVNNHNAMLPSQYGFVSTDLINISITVVKKAEKRNGLILRCVEFFGLGAQGMIEIKMLNRKFYINVLPFEIKSLFVPFDPKKEICEVNLLED